MNYCCANGLCFTEDVAEMGQYRCLKEVLLQQEF